MDEIIRCVPAAEVAKSFQQQRNFLVVFFIDVLAKALVSGASGMDSKIFSRLFWRTDS